MKILAVVLLLGIMLSSCGNKADSERLNDSAFTTTAESSAVDSDSMDVDESSQVGNESDIQSDSSEDDMKWRLFEDTYKETDSGRAAENYAHNKGIKIEGFVKYGQENPPVCDLTPAPSVFLENADIHTPILPIKTASIIVKRTNSNTCFC